MAKKITVVLSQHQGKHPGKQQLEEDIAVAMITHADVDFSIIPHLYDLSHDHTGMLFLKSVPGDIVVISWLYPRAARWMLDRAGVKGHEGEVLITPADDDVDETDEEVEAPPSRGIGTRDVPNRKIYCLDLRDHSDAQVFIDELKRIARESTGRREDLLSWFKGKPKEEQLRRYLISDSPAAAETSIATLAPPETGEQVRRRWYPVIDYSRCTNCMECIDFCLFGVYGIDDHSHILVEQQDNCKKGCPACSRVCPENAIIFPQYKSAAIAGANVAVESGSAKIDLSKLFGGDDGADALATAVAERDRELVADGRSAVGMEVGIPKRQANRQATSDELDSLMDQLDKFDW